MNNLKNEQVFIENLIDNFPELEEEILDEDYLGIITLQIGCFKRFTQKAIDSNDLATAKECFRFVDENIDQVEGKIENALYITYLGHLKFEKNNAAKKLLPDRLKSAIKDITTHENSTPKNNKLNDFLNDL